MSRFFWEVILKVCNDRDLCYNLRDENQVQWLVEIYGKSE